MMAQAPRTKQAAESCMRARTQKSEQQEKQSMGHRSRSRAQARRGKGRCYPGEQRYSSGKRRHEILHT